MTSTSPISAVSAVDFRARHVQYRIESSKGNISTEAANAEVDQSERDQLLFAELQESIASGRLQVPDGPLLAERIQAARKAGFEAQPGPIAINALNVESAIGSQTRLKGGDLKSLNLYMDYLRTDISLAKQVKSEVIFTGAWAEKTTNDVEEYIGWLQSAMIAQSAKRQD